MFQITRDPSSGSFIQCLAKITVMHGTNMKTETLHFCAGLHMLKVTASILLKSQKTKQIPSVKKLICDMCLQVSLCSVVIECTHVCLHKMVDTKLFNAAQKIS